MQKSIEALNLDTNEQDTLSNFFRCINLCHDCISLKDKNNPDKIVYNGPSVDEVCLLEMSEATKISKFISRDSDSIKLMLNG